MVLKKKQQLFESYTSTGIQIQDIRVDVNDKKTSLQNALAPLNNIGGVFSTLRAF